MDSIILPKPLYCIAHRGGVGNHTENTLAALQQCLTLPVDAIEIDTWQIGGELLITHDRRLGRTLPGQGRLIDHHPEYLRNLEMACGNKIASLHDILQLVGNKATLNIELKGPGCSEPVAELLEAFVRDTGASFDNYVISSFDQHQLFDFKQRLPQVKRGVLVEGIPLHYAQCCDELEAYSFHPNVNFINRDLVDDAHNRGLQVWVYTVNEIDDLCHMSELGVDGVFTDHPQKLLDLNQLSQNQK
ncbi:MAG: glycerophosphodiester phosphodiesterase [Candidatus Pelagadaptatus aseana]|uniref:glycerophosphodiester phosphodiesterase n=1 Tax=Candidatus Pelagadaptatus aseana TaxID=3120508 RepID=UPI0039B2D1AA